MKMGILALQRDEKWRIEIREVWKVSTKVDKDDFIDFLARHKVKHTIEYTETHTIFNFDNPAIEFEDYKEFLITINQLFEYKRVYTQEYMDKK